MISEIVLICIGISMITFGLIVDANNNLASKLLFKVVPFFSGCHVSLYGLNVLGVFA